VIATWAGEFDVGYSNRKTLAEVIEVAEKTSQTFNGVEPDNPELLSILQQVTKTRRGLQLNSLALGYWLRANKGKIVDGKRFARQPSKRGESAAWWLEEVVSRTATKAIF
jgi:hypothetical protein